MSLFFFFNDPPTTEIYTLSLHDALPIWQGRRVAHDLRLEVVDPRADRHRSSHRLAHLAVDPRRHPVAERSEEHTSELQSRLHLVCRLLLEKKKKKNRLLRIGGAGRYSMS